MADNDSPNTASDKPDEKVDPNIGLQSPPTSLWGTLKRIGPGLVLAGSIVGSGELIATTSTGAAAGFSLLWLIIIGCIIKVFVQVELGKFTLISGKTTLDALHSLPGTFSIKGPGGRSLRGNFITLFWLLMFMATIGQLGGIVGGVGEAMSISWPLTQEGRQVNAKVDAKTKMIIAWAEYDKLAQIPNERSNPRPILPESVKIAKLQASLLAENNAEELLPLWVSYHKKTETATVTPVPIAELQDGETLTNPQRADRLAKMINNLAVGNKVYLQKVIVKNAKNVLSGRHAELMANDARTEKESKFMAALPAHIEKLDSLQKEIGPMPTSNDAKYWAAIIGAVTVVMLVIGKYGLIEMFSIVLVGLFTLVTIGNLFALQSQPQWAVTASDIGQGLSFGLPPDADGSGGALMIALATFGIIGVGASELFAYPYWCLEKGYAKWTGKHDQSDAWASRARGWLRVMKWDAWGSMVLYTFATIAFYLLGASILHPAGLRPGGGDLVRTLAVMYEPVFGETALTIFLFGAFAVLYSTFFVANAGNSRMAADIIPAFGLADLTENGRKKWIRFFGFFFPTACVVIYCLIPAPVQLILLSGVMQALLLPMLGLAALVYRYKLGDPRLKPNKIWDACLWLSFIGFLVVGIYLVCKKGPDLFSALFG
jgi:Mn2+/Fe2+ NRAMP family transporter